VPANAALSCRNTPGLCLVTRFLTAPQYARRFDGTGILINAVCPGYVATDFTGHGGTRTPEQGAAVSIRFATLPYGGPTGGFYNEDGVIPW